MSYSAESLVKSCVDDARRGLRMALDVLGEDNAEQSVDNTDLEGVMQAHTEAVAAFATINAALHVLDQIGK